MDKLPVQPIKVRRRRSQILTLNSTRKLEETISIEDTPKKLSFTVYFSGKRRSLLHPNTAQRFFYHLQSYSRKTLRKIAPKSARKYWESISDRAHAHEHGLLFCFVLFLLTFWYHSMHLELEFQFSHGSSSHFMGVEPQCTVSLNSSFSLLSCTGM